MTTFVANYPGVCNSCGTKYPVGVLIESQSAYGTGRTGKSWRHIICPTNTEERDDE